MPSYLFVGNKEVSEEILVFVQQNLFKDAAM